MRNQANGSVTTGSLLLQHSAQTLTLGSVHRPHHKPDDPGLASETHMCLRDIIDHGLSVSATRDHNKTTQCVTCLRVTTHRLLSPQTVAVAVTTDSLTLKHTPARQQMYEHQRRLRHRGLSPTQPHCFCNTRAAARVCNQNTIQATGRVTTDSLLLQHTCVCADTDPGLASLLTPANVRVCACVYVCLRAKKRHAAKS